MISTRVEAMTCMHGRPFVRRNDSIVVQNVKEEARVGQKTASAHYQSARRGHVFHTFFYLYRKYVVYLVARRIRLGNAHCASAKRMRIHDNILRTRCMNVIVYGCARFYD